MLTIDGDIKSYKWAIHCDAVFGDSNTGKLKDNFACGVDQWGGNDGNLKGQLNKWSVAYAGPKAPRTQDNWKAYLMLSCHIELIGDHSQQEWEKYDCNDWEGRKLLQKPYSDNSDWKTKYVYSVLVANPLLQSEAR